MFVTVILIIVLSLVFISYLNSNHSLPEEKSNFSDDIKENSRVDIIDEDLINTELNSKTQTLFHDDAVSNSATLTPISIKYITPEGLICSNYNRCKNDLELFKWNKYNLHFDEEVNAFILDCNNCCLFNAEISYSLDSDDKEDIFKVKIQEGIEFINNRAFSHSVVLEEIILPNSITKIKSYTFSNCLNLKNVILPKDLVYIEEYAFENCSKLTSIEFHDKFQITGKYAFRLCTNLRRITINSHKFSCYMNSFYGCKELTELYYNAEHMAKSLDFPYLKKLHIGERVTEFSNRALIYDERYLPDDFELNPIKIEISSNNKFLIMDEVAIYSIDKNVLYSVYNTTIKDYYVPNTVRIIHDYAFAYSKLDSIVFHDKIEKFNINCIEGCDNIDLLFSEGSYVDLYLRQIKERDARRKRREMMGELLLRAESGPKSRNGRHITR